MSEITTLDNETSAHRLDSAQTETLTPDKYKYEKVCDRQGHPVEGLWERNGVYYIQAYIEGKGTRKLALYNPQKERVKNVAEAKAAMAEFQKSKQSGNLPASGRCPKFKEYYEEKYLKVVSKDPKTLKKERGNLQLWEKTLGELRLNQIRMEHLQAHVSVVSRRIRYPLALSISTWAPSPTASGRPSKTTGSRSQSSPRDTTDWTKERRSQPDCIPSRRWKLS